MLGWRCIVFVECGWLEASRVTDARTPPWALLTLLTWMLAFLLMHNSLCDSYWPSEEIGKLCGLGMLALDVAWDTDAGVADAGGGGSGPQDDAWSSCMLALSISPNNYTTVYSAHSVLSCLPMICLLQPVLLSALPSLLGHFGYLPSSIPTGNFLCSVWLTCKPLANLPQVLTTHCINCNSFLLFLPCNLKYLSLH